MSRSSTLLQVLAFALLACQASQGERETPAAAGSAAGGPPAETASAQPWQYTPALRAATEPGMVVEPVFELADGRTGRAQIGVAVGTGTDVRLEVWDFDQNNPRDRLERVGEPRELVAADGGRAEIDAVRTAIARPGNEYVRPRGLDGPPEKLVKELASLASLAGDGEEPLRSRVSALARLVRALDDHVLFERNLLPALRERLPVASREVAQTEALGERRQRLTLKEPPHVLVFARSGERWVLSDVEFAQSSAPAAPAAEPSPTAP